MSSVDYVAYKDPTDPINKLIIRATVYGGVGANGANRTISVTGNISVDKNFEEGNFVTCIQQNVRGMKRYEITNYLGNVHAVLTDRKLPVQDLNNPSRVAFYQAEVVSYTDYYPFGMTMPGRSGNSDAYNRGFNGELKDNEIKGEGNSYDFGARIYDARLGRWFATDKLFAKRPAQSPYAFVGNNPIINKELDGNDYEVEFIKSDKGNKLIIRATVYTDVKGSDSHTAAVKATEFWNSQNGKFKYQVNETNGSKTEYDVVFDIKVEPTAFKTEAQHQADNDKKGNSITTHPRKDNKGLSGYSENDQCYISEDRKDSDTPAHELGHQFNLGHSLVGIMKDGEGTINIERDPIVTKENVQQIIDWALGKGNSNSTTSKEGKPSETTLKNPQNVKTEGEVKYDFK